MKDTIAPEMAEQEFKRMCGFFDVDSDEDMSDEEQAAFDRIKGKITSAIKNGSLALGVDGAPTYITKRGAALTFKEPTGATLLVKVSDDDPVRKMLAIAMDLTGGVTSPAKLSMKDTGVLAAIVNLFMSELA